MIPRTPQIIECQRYSCDQRLVKHEFESGNMTGATFWTDGRMDAPMMPEYSDFSRCPECGWFFWVSQAKELGPYIPMKRISEEDPDKVEDIPNYPDVKEPSFKQYLEALDSKLGRWPNSEKELLVKAWRKFNDSMRPNLKKEEECRPISWMPESRENATQVLRLLNERDLDDSVAKAELLRELGRFGPSLQMLDVIDEYGMDDDSYYQTTLKRIRDLAEGEISELAVIHPPGRLETGAGAPE